MRIFDNLRLNPGAESDDKQGIDIMMLDEFNKYKEIAPFDIVDFPCQECNSMLFTSFFVSFDSRDYGSSMTLKL